MSPAAGLALLTAHLLGDFVAQTDRMAAAKRNPAVLLFHASIHAGLAWLLLGQWAFWPAPLAVLLSHAGIDAFKARWPKGRVAAFLADQALHLAVLAILAALSPRLPGCWEAWIGRDWLRALILASGAILCIRAVAVLVGLWVQPYLDEMKALAPAAPGARGLTNGGRAIGQGERALIFLFVVMGQPGAIGFLIAAKSIFRFGELSDRRNRMEAEYITIGTLMSFGLAVAIAAGTAFALRRLP